jgi:hypothetical protein
MMLPKRFILSAILVSLSQTPRSQAVVPSLTRGVRLYSTSTLLNLARKSDDFIDAEIVDSRDGPKDEKRKSGRAGGTIINRWDDDENDNDRKEKGGLLSKVASFFGMDKESREKRERKREINTAIDRAFQGTGLLGGLMGGIAKTVGGMMAETMYEATKDFEMVQSAVVRRLEMDSSVTKSLGDMISLSQPFTSSSSSMNINGVVTKQYFYIMSASGDRGMGQVQVRASMEGGDKVMINELILQTQDGRVIRVGDGGRGPSGGKIIDAEIL